MKNNAPTKNPKQNIKFNTNRHKPENKDNLDSREGEEQILKGIDTTHNVKYRKTGQSRKGR